MIGARRVLGRKFRRKGLDRALRVHDLCCADAGEVELHRECLGEQARIAARNARAAALAHLDVGDSERLESAQRVARHDPADAETGGEILLSTEEITGLELFGKQRVAHLADDLPRERGRMTADEDWRGFVRSGLDGRMDGHSGWLGGMIVKIVSYGRLSLSRRYRKG